MVRISSSPLAARLRRSLAAWLVASLVVVAGSAVAQTRLTAARVQTRLERIEQQAKEGEWQRVEREGERLLRDLQATLVASGAAGDEWSQIVAMVFTLRALAASAEGRTEDALWHWPLAQSLWPELSRFTLTAYGEPAAFLRENRLDRKGSTYCGGEEGPDEEDAPIEVDPAERSGGDVEAPVKIEAPSAKYPFGASISQTEDRVVVGTIIGTDGRVQQPVLVRYRSLALALAAVEPLRRWRFEPSTLDGVPVEVYYCLSVNFEM